MAHETHHEEGHHHHDTEATPKISLFSAFWFVLILVGLFVAAINFVSVESKSGEEEHAATEQHHEGATEVHGEAHEVTPTTAPEAAHTENQKEGEHAAEQPAAEHVADTTNTHE